MEISILNMIHGLSSIGYSLLDGVDDVLLREKCNLSINIRGVG